jgi:hypothetical protein
MYSVLRVAWYAVGAGRLTHSESLTFVIRSVL